MNSPRPRSVRVEPGFLIASLLGAVLLAAAWSTGGHLGVLLGAAAGGLVAAAVMHLVTQGSRDRERQQAATEKARVEQRVSDLEPRLAGARDAVRTVHALLAEQATDLSSRGESTGTHTQLLHEAASEMSSWIRNVGDSIGQLSSSTEETSSSVYEMVATIEETAGHIEGVADAVNETAGSTTAMVETITGIDGNVERLRKFVSETSGAMEQVTAAIRQVETRTTDSDHVSERVAGDAEAGQVAVQSTIEGMMRIRGAVEEASEAISQLGRRSEEIGGILSVIEEVAEQTNLLALNAAIIAAQAGDHGKGFAVVADEIRGLAERTSSSTREIAALITFFQEEAGRARQGMADGSHHVKEGMALAERAGESLTTILNSARESSRMAADIAQTTQEQVQGTHIVVEAVGRVEDMVIQLSSITAEQTAQSESIMGTVCRMRQLTEQVRRATVEQAKGGRLITEAIRSVTDNVATIHQATVQQDTESDKIVTALSALRAGSSEAENCSARVAQARDTLGGVLESFEISSAEEGVRPL